MEDDAKAYNQVDGDGGPAPLPGDFGGLDETDAIVEHHDGDPGNQL